MGRRRPRAQMEAPDAPTGTSWSVEAELLAEPGGLGPAGQEGVGGHVDPSAGERSRTAASRPAGRRPRAPPPRATATGAGAGHQLPGRGQAGDAAPDHRHGAGVGPASWGSTAGADVRRGPADHLGQHAEEAGVVVERRGPGEGHPDRPGHLVGLDVEVVEDLEVVGDEAHRAHHHRGGPLRRPPDGSPPAGRVRSTGRRSARRSATPPPSSGRARRRGRAGRRCRRPTRPPGRDRGRPRPPPGGGGCGR